MERGAGLAGAGITGIVGLIFTVAAGGAVVGHLVVVIDRRAGILRVGIERKTVEQTSPHVILVESRAGTICFGEHLAPNERRWIVAALHRAVALGTQGQGRAGR
jgi:hypothetical protein